MIDTRMTIALIAIHHLSGLNGRSSAKLAFEALQFGCDIVLSPMVDRSTTTMLCR